ncbi:bile acid:sodium symporter family protein [Pelagicoccus sp. SDUM812003]|uniref:bile acid:sodium symporter family protein n=1 Tax=Pelagicoccus sp. SDUM812003 TaxID=3041267 RepID=UPI00280F78F6|nr:bile acid:sodium symporter family protein [Pelagicoccus sp. SDUM812003]MDQ8205475.1 bile acid:sodium symporter [Pelagicoccus sp. SDUM812003]
MPVRIKNLLASQSFTLALVGAVVVAILLPDLGVKGGPLRAELTTKIAVFLTFLLQGLSLPTRQIAASAAKFKIHFYCQVANFVIAPLLMLGYLPLVGMFLIPDIHPGFLYLAALPTTISSAIVMTSSSGGDGSTALFSTTLSNILGIFITPTLCAFLLATGPSQGGSLGELIGKLSLLVLLPIVVGQLLRPFVREWVNRSKKLFKRLSNGFIVFIVYAAFCQSVKNGIWLQIGAPAVLATLVVTLVFLLLFSSVVWFGSKLITSRRPERIAAFFCGSQKTLATGVPMASVIFANQSGSMAAVSIGLIILPLMCYHPLQLILAGLLSPRFTKWAEEA